MSRLRRTQTKPRITSSGRPRGRHWDGHLHIRQTFPRTTLDVLVNSDETHFFRCMLSDRDHTGTTQGPQSGPSLLSTWMAFCFIKILHLCLGVSGTCCPWASGCDIAMSQSPGQANSVPKSHQAAPMVTLWSHPSPVGAQG